MCSCSMKMSVRTMNLLFGLPSVGFGDLKVVLFSLLLRMEVYT